MIARRKLIISPHHGTSTQKTLFTPTRLTFLLRGHTKETGVANVELSRYYWDYSFHIPKPLAMLLRADGSWSSTMPGNSHACSPWSAASVADFKSVAGLHGRRCIPCFTKPISKPLMALKVMTHTLNCLAYLTKLCYITYKTSHLYTHCYKCQPLPVLHIICHSKC